MPRYDRMGLLWLLKGETVTLMAADAAILSGGLRDRRVHPLTREDDRP